MDSYVTGNMIKMLRERKGYTQAELAEKLGVTSKAVSKWETANGFPDISLIKPLAEALSVSVTELMSGNIVMNKNRSANILKTKFHVCPVCGNIIQSTGEALISCCGITLPALEAEEIDEEHKVNAEYTEDEYFISVDHEMTKEHYISFAAFVTSERVQFVKFYPEGNAETRLSFRGGGYLYIYCSKHGLMRKMISRKL